MNEGNKADLNPRKVMSFVGTNEGDASFKFESWMLENTDYDLESWRMSTTCIGEGCDSTVVETIVAVFVQETS